MTVRQHLEFALKVRRRPVSEIAARVQELARLLDIQPLLNRNVKGLSGGEAQRVALGRALSFGPSVLLLDEPLSALDADTRQSTQELLKNLNELTGVSVLHVTHNQEEAEMLGDRVIRLVKAPDTGHVVVESP
jgi:ABC-type sugar transport system ATPase subunit